MSGYIPNRKNLVQIELRFAKLLQKLDQQAGMFRSSLLKFFVSVVALGNERLNFKRLDFRRGRHVVTPISKEEFQQKTVWGLAGIREYLDNELTNALGQCRLGLDMFISRIPNGTPNESFGSLTLAPKHFSDNQERDLTQKFDSQDFVFPSSLFLLGNIDGERKEAALPVLMLSSNCGLINNHDGVNRFSRDSLGINLILEDTTTGDIAVDGENWLKGNVQLRGKSILLNDLYKSIFQYYKFWSGYTEEFDNFPECCSVFGLLFIPSGNDYRSRTALLCPVKLRLDASDFSRFSQRVFELVENVSLLVKLLGGLFEKYLAHAVEGLVNERLMLASTYSARAVIMARNGSHNIGSHVLSALSHNVGTMPDDRILYQYIQHRMDYIASTSTGAVDWSVPTPFVGNLMKLFYSQRHLLEHIAESDGLHAYQYQGKGTQVGSVQKDCVKIVVRRISHTPKDGWNHAKVFGKDVWMYIFFHEGVAKEGKTDSNGERIMPDVTDKPVAWKNDEDVSVPGGILGQHAFYNIVENVIRNAAKHSWAGKSEDERGAQNLEIYVDFEKDLDDETMCFTVGDNMSRLFCEDFWNDAFNYLASSENSIELPPGFSSWPEVFALPLDGFIVPSNAEVSNRQKVQDYLDGKGNLDDLPSQYKALCDYVVKKWDELKSKESFKAILKGNPDKNEDNGEIDGLGHRLPLPLHHRQELSLAEPFINLETNQLRQSAWGLSEMKISAGYLRRANVSVIGGLESLKSEQGKAPHPLIAPIGIPSGGNGGELLWKDLCLAYRFWIALPKDVLIVADHEDKWKRFSGAGWEGIGVISYETVFGKDETKGDIGLMSDYGFVIVDHDKKLEPYNQLKLPFRSLIVVDYEQSAEGMPYVLRSELNDTSQREFVSCVYKAWLNYLKRRRGPKNIPNPDKELTIRLNIFEKKGAEKGLITDKDIYKVLFRECLHSVLEAITVDMSIGQLQRKALLMVSLYPLDENDDLFKGSAEMFTGNHRLNIENLLRKIAANVRNYLTSSPCSSEGDGNCSKWRRLTDAYRVGLKRAAETMKYPKIAKDLLIDLDTQPCNSTRSCDSALLRELDAMATGSSESGIIEAAVQALDVARTTSDVFLRKYEERIVTLPPQYKGSVKSNDKPLDFSRFGVQIAFEGDADISYNRHSTDDAPLYSEPLSGSQSYLNALANLSGQDDQWAMRLAENGLLRIVVIDERVRAFVVEHEEIRKTYESMHIAVVDTEKKPSFKPDGTSLPECNDGAWNYVAGDFGDPHFDPDFDLVVIHQGIIDKWWSDHSQNAVKGILEKLRTRNGSPNGRFVVVTTGRGRPDNIPETAKVLAFSTIETFLFKRYPEKLNFVNSLMSILPGSTERNGDND